MINEETTVERALKPLPVMDPESVPEGWVEAMARFTGSTMKLQSAYLSLKAHVHRLNQELGNTNRKLKENLREKERLRSYLGHILEGLSVGVLVCDLGGAITLSNRAARCLLGMEHDPVGRSLAEELAGPLGESAAGKIVSPKRKAFGRTSEHRVRDTRGETRNIVFKYTPLRDSLGVELGMLITVEDLTELRSMQDEVARSQRLAAMGEMAASIAHEVRNPLGSIHLFSTLMAREPEARAREKVGAKIQSAIGAVENIIANLLTFARPMRPRLARLDPGSLLKDCLDFVGPLAGQQEIAINLVNKGGVPRVDADRGLLKQALLNLLLNALQAMPRGGRVRAWAKRSGPAAGIWSAPGTERGRGWVEIGIEDTGEGIHEDAVSKIFDPFFTTRDEGTGLGLTIVHNIVKAHGGRVRVRSAPGEGSRVTLHIPRAAGKSLKE